MPAQRIARSRCLSLASEVLPVQADNLDYWLPLIHDALVIIGKGSGGRWDADDIVRLLREKKVQLWLIVDGKVIEAVNLTSIIIYPKLKALRFEGTVGRGFRKWAHLHEVPIEWAKEQGCTRFEILAPRKWRAALPSSWREFHVLYERD